MNGAFMRKDKFGNKYIVVKRHMTKPVRGGWNRFFLKSQK